MPSPDPFSNCAVTQLNFPAAKEDGRTHFALTASLSSLASLTSDFESERLESRNFAVKETRIFSHDIHTNLFEHGGDFDKSSEFLELLDFIFWTSRLPERPA
jgi:hypothetical protein